MDDAIPLMVQIIDAHERRNFMRIQRRRLRDDEDPFDVTDFQFMSTYRFPKEVAKNLIDMLTPHAQPLIRRNGIPLHLKVLITLHFLATGSYQKPIGCSAWTAVSQPTVSRCISSICELITRILMPQKVKFPTAPNTKASSKQGFYAKWDFRGVLGVIDGTHVGIIAPPSTDEEHPPFVYVNRKGYHSINVMLICDSDTRIIACDARYPGSVHDSAVWQVCDVRNHLRRKYENGDINSWLIGDSGYGVEPWLFTPVPNAIDDSPESHFNDALGRTRNIIEWVIGILKTRFRCLLKHRILHYHPAKAAFIVYACVVLHNIAIEVNLNEPEIEMVVELDRFNDVAVQIVDADVANVAVQGRARRADYIRRNFMQ